MKKIKILNFITLLLIPVISAQADWNTGLNNAGGFGLPYNSVYDIITSFLEWLLMIFTVLAVLAFVISGVMYLTAGAVSDNAQKAKDMMKYSIMGIAVALSGYIIINFIDSVLLGYIY